MLLWLLLLFVGVGCSSTGSRSGTASLAPGHWTPIDHARSQLDWIRGSSGSLSEEELFHAMNTPWKGRRLTQSQREQWIRDQLLEDSGGSQPAAISGRRVLDRPSVMNAATKQWQQELKERGSNQE